MSIHETRRQKLAERFRELKIDAALVTTPVNIRYLSGFTGSNAMLLVDRDKSRLFTDPRYAIQASQETNCKVNVASGPLPDAVVKVARGRVGIENTRIGYELYTRIDRHLRLSPLGSVIEEMRTVKSPEEADLIRASMKLNSQAYSRGLRRIRPGMTERDLAAELEYQMRRLGAERPAFDTIVATRERSALPHAQPTGAEVMRHGLLLVDMGACLRGYCSDMTRTVSVGRPRPAVRRLYGAVLEAQLAALDAVRAGVTAGSVDAAARRVLRKAGLDKAFVHSTGHGLGLEIHEGPRLAKKQETRLAAGMVVTVEPGVYMEGFGGIRIEDTVLVTERGCENLTPTPKELVVL